MSEILDMKLTYYNNRQEDLQSSNGQRQFKKKAREDLDFWLYVISKTILGLMVPSAESVKLILCLTGINVSLEALSCIFSQWHFISNWSRFNL